MSLPSGYKRLEHIQSSGTQYINTGFKPNQNTRVILDIYLAQQSSYPKAIFGGRNGVQASDASFTLFAISASNFRSDFNTSNLTISVSTIGRFLIDKNKKETTVNGTKYTNASSTFQSNYELCLFTLLEPSGVDSRMAEGKLYSCQIYDNNVLVRDFIPCKKPDGTVGLWDDVNSVFYANAGTGTFTAGPIVASPSIFVNIDGIWKPINNIYVNINNIWQEAT